MRIALVLCVVTHVLHAQDVVCAQVTIQISQQAVLTRSAFEATLTVTNTTPNLIENFLVEFDITKDNGVPGNAFFQVSDPILTGFTGVNGSGTLAPGSPEAPSIGIAQWTLVPTDLAATSPDGPTVYNIGGQVSNVQAGTPVVVPLFPVPVDVYPDAKLFLKYFLQSPVYSDSPFTDAIEPPEPFSLGLFIQNDGLGSAKELTITSSQPEIIENDKGLLVAFEILAAQLGLEEVMPCLTVTFGDIPPGGFSVARWLMTSTLQGYFTEYSVMFEHVNSLNLKTLSEVEVEGTVSLIANAEIFELDHAVRVAVPVDDELPDFLVNDPPGLAGIEAEYLTTTQQLHCSDGTVKSVARVDAAMFDGPPTTSDLSVVMSVDVTEPGWNYLRILDPAGEEFAPELVERRDGACGLPCAGTIIQVGGPGDIVNAWRTSRWEDIDVTDPVLTTRLHVLDYLAEPGTYDYVVSYSPSLRVDDVIVNGGLSNRSTTSSVKVAFTAPTNVEDLIQSGDITTAARIVLRDSSHLGGVPLDLDADRYSWDPIERALVVDLSIEGEIEETISILPEGNYELRLDTSAITTPAGESTLQDDDDDLDGTWTFGDQASDAFYRLTGDGVGLDRRVNDGERTLIRKNWKGTVGAPGIDPNADMDGDGEVENRDYALVRSNYGDTLAFSP